MFDFPDACEPIASLSTPERQRTKELCLLGLMENTCSAAELDTMRLGRLTENPERVATIQRLTPAYLRSRLYLEDPLGLRHVLP
jgi:hypothetical protein